MKKRLWLKITLGALAALLLLLVAFIAFLTITEYRPKDRQIADIAETDSETSPVGNTLTIYSWNIGYAGLDASSDFFMDGGSKVNPTKEDVENNLSAIKSFISSTPADAWLLQEVDVDSSRTGSVNELEAVFGAYKGNLAFAYNYKCSFVPIPVPPIGKVASGIATMTSHTLISSPERISLPCPFSWPVSTANLKRCLLVTRLKTDDCDKEVVLVNLHLEAYDDGEGKLAQTKLLMQILGEEYEKGNYVIAGGDFNQSFPGALDAYPLKSDSWLPGALEEDDLPEDFTYAFDLSAASCRLLDHPLDESSQLYVIDGFILSPNVRLDLVETIDLSFANSDHNPVKLQITLMP